MPKCMNCTHCDISMLMCRPESKDCAEEYALDEEDLTTDDRCDFYRSRPNYRIGSDDNGPKLFMCNVNLRDIFNKEYTTHRKERPHD